MNFKDEMKQKVAQIEIILDEYLPAQEGLQKTVLTAMNTTVKAGGKRLRPMLINETYQMFGGKGDIVKPFMAAIEMIHTYSLIHDDLPALDNDDYRRGQKTCHIVYGEDMAILAGDALLNYAYEVATKAFDLAEKDQIMNVVEAIKKIIDFGVEQMVYISCKPTSLARDLEVFEAAGYKVKRATAVDQFPNTVHIESMVLIQKDNI